VRLDLLYEVDVPKPWEGGHPWGQRRGERRAYAEALEQIQLADRRGFHCVWMVEHHFREGRSHCPAPEVWLGALSQCTQNLRLGFGVTLLPFAFTHPARVAEKVATADLLSRGRVEWGTGRSTPMEQSAFGVDRARSRDQWREAIEMIVAMWERERFSWKSDTFGEFPERVVTPKPWQDPHPPCWVAASSDDTATVAGEHGLGLLSLSILRSVESLAKQIEQYRAAIRRAKPLTRVLNDRVAAYTLVHCAETMEQAERNRIWDSVWWWYKHLAEFTIEWELPNMTQAEVDQVFPLMKSQLEGKIPVEHFDAADMVVVGDPDRVFEKMRRYVDIGVDQLICYVQFGTIPHEAVMRSIELLGREVIPRLEAYGASRRAGAGR
jgi:alkanesulfonate monooxygenase SsuD/methylene tetrahydromethanopterin reductase-like flavin-dependent oxidoreductase (luciferase family)